MTSPVAASRAVNRKASRIVVGAPLDLSRAHGKQRLGSIQRLNLALLNDTQNERALRSEWAISRAFSTNRGSVKLERLGAMGLKIEGRPDPINRRFAQTRRPSPSNTGSSALRPSASSQGSGERPRRRRRRSARRVRTRLVVETRHPQRARRLMSLFFAPSAACKTIRAHWARLCAVLRRDARLSSSRRSLCLKSIATAVLPHRQNPPP